MSKHKKKGKIRQKKRCKSNKLRRNIAILVLLLLIVIKVSYKQKNTEISLILNNEEITQDLSNGLFNVDEVVYMSFHDILKYIDKTIYLENDNRIITTSSKKVASLEIGKSEITINGSEKSILDGPIKINENIFLPISELESVYDMNFDYSKHSNIAIIEDLSTKKTIATAKKKLKIKKDKSLFSKTLTKVKKEDIVVYISEEGNWSKVMTGDGYIGYVKTKKLSNIVAEREEFKVEETIKNGGILEKDITNKDISNFEKREELIENIFTEAIKNDKMQIKIICKGQNESFERLEIEAKPVFNECGINSEFLKIQ